MLTATTTMASSRGLGESIFDSIISRLTKTAVGTATLAAQPLIDDIEKRVKAMILPVAIFTAGSLLIGLLTYREVRRSRAGKSLSGTRRR